MGFPVDIEGGDRIEMVKKLDGNRVVDADGNVYERTMNALLFKPTGDQLTLFEVNEPGDNLALAGTEPLITPIEQFEALLNESAERELGTVAEEAGDVIEAVKEGIEEVADEVGDVIEAVEDLLTDDEPEVGEAVAEDEEATEAP